jgi:hypothetical protein
MVDINKIVSSQSHSGREADLMKAGNKPMAMFCGWDERQNVIYDQQLDELSEEGVIIRNDKVYKIKSRLSFYIFFNKPEELWRFHAIDLMMRFSTKRGIWTPELEWIKSSLLGYSDIEADRYVKMLYAKR